MAEIKIYAKPSHLHRYRPLGDKCDREVRALLQGYIYCPAFCEMNDPMEGAHRMSARFLENANSEKSRERVQAALHKMGIASLSEVYDHEPMWAHYADQFKGMCVQYSTNRLLKGLANDVAITRMMYSEKEPVLLDEKATSVDRARLCLSSKTVRWANEREWRIFRLEKGAAEYSSLNTVTKVFLGSRVSQSDERRVRAAGEELGVPVFKMDIDAYSIGFKAARKLKMGQKPRKDIAG